MVQSGLRREISPNILKTFLLIFVGMAFLNSIIFGIAEYRYSKKLILRDFKYIASSANRALADTIWRSDKVEMSEIVDGLLKNYNISAIKVTNYETKYVETFKVKSGRQDSISHSSDLIFKYDNKNVKVATLQIYTDSTAIFYRAKKTLALLLLKTVIETLTIFILLFWAFKKLFIDYLSEIEKIIESRKYLPVDVETNNSLPILERAFRDVLNNMFLLIFKYSEDKTEEREKKEDKKEIEVEDEVVQEVDEAKITLQRILDFVNPTQEFMDRFLKESFVYSQPVKDGGGDVYLFSEIEKNRELLLLLVDYGNVEGLSAVEMSIILKEIEKDLMVKHSLNNRLFALSKIVEFMDKKIRSRFAENGLKALDEAEFKGVALYYDKINNTFEYSAKGVVILKKDIMGKFSTYDDYGLYSDRTMQHQAVGESRREHKIDMAEGDSLYIVTDGIFRQVKRDKAKEEIGKKGFMEILTRISQESFKSQSNSFDQEFTTIKGDKPQVDNVTVIGFQV